MNRKLASKGMLSSRNYRDRVMPLGVNNTQYSPRRYPNLRLGGSVCTPMSSNGGSNHVKYHVFEEGGSHGGNSWNDRSELHGSWINV